MKKKRKRPKPQKPSNKVYEFRLLASEPDGVGQVQMDKWLKEKLEDALRFSNGDEDNEEDAEHEHC